MNCFNKLLMNSCWCCFSVGREQHKIEKFSEEDLKTMKRSNFEGKVVARVCSIYDGDTLDLAFLYRGKITRKPCRMYGIDTPEMKMKHCATDTHKIIEQKMQVKQLAIEARKYTESA